jgi:hypothetical protein
VNLQALNRAYDLASSLGNSFDEAHVRVRSLVQTFTLVRTFALDPAFAQARALATALDRILTTAVATAVATAIALDRARDTGHDHEVYLAFDRARMLAADVRDALDCARNLAACARTAAGSPVLARVLVNDLADVNGNSLLLVKRIERLVEQLIPMESVSSAGRSVLRPSPVAVRLTGWAVRLAPAGYRPRYGLEFRGELAEVVENCGQWGQTVYGVRLVVSAARLRYELRGARPEAMEAVELGGPPW